jgi:hypothetical protein
MRQLLCVGLVAAAISGGAAADPATPQLSPLHRQREDAQRLHEQQRDLERQAPAAASPPATNRPPADAAAGVTTRHTTRTAGLVLLGVAGLSAVVALPLRSSDSTMPGVGASAENSISDLLLVTAAITATGGIVLLLSDRTIRVGPTVTARSVGISLMGRI